MDAAGDGALEYDEFRVYLTFGWWWEDLGALLMEEAVEDCLAAVERLWHTQDIQGSIPDQSFVKRLKLFTLHLKVACINSAPA